MDSLCLSEGHQKAARTEGRGDKGQGKENTAWKTEATKGKTEEGIDAIEDTSIGVHIPTTSTPPTGKALSHEGVKQKEGVKECS